MGLKPVVRVEIGTHLETGLQLFVPDSFFPNGGQARRVSEARN